MHPKHWLLTGLAILATFLVFALTQAQAPQPQVAPCLLAWEELTWDERSDCGQPLGGLKVAEVTVYAIRQQTVAALPTVPRASIRATQRARWEAAGLPTSRPTPVPWTMPAGWEVIEAYHNPYRGDDNPKRWLRFMVNAWWIGATFTDAGEPRRLIVISASERCSLWVSHIKRDGWPAGGEGYGWVCPEDIGWLRITGATGQTGILTLTDALDRTVTFDLATEEWTLAGAPWLPAATPTPTP